ncbi:MAG: biotin/lipoyl-containing protein [Gammaproteobacteria bacterium]
MTVEKGDVLLSLEAMKMEVLLRAEVPGVIAWIPVAVGMRVEAGDLLVELE